MMFSEMPRTDHPQALVCLRPGMGLQRYRFYPSHECQSILQNNISDPENVPFGLSSLDAHWTPAEWLRLAHLDPLVSTFRCESGMKGQERNKNNMPARIGVLWSGIILVKWVNQSPRSRFKTKSRHHLPLLYSWRLCLYIVLTLSTAVMIKYR